MLFGLRELAPAFLFWGGCLAQAWFDAPKTSPLKSSVYELQIL
jgi:hypothetical protein